MGFKPFDRLWQALTPSPTPRESSAWPGISWGACSLQGDRPDNQDQCAFWREGPWLCAVLADGAGGHAAGALAAQTVINQWLGLFACAPSLNPTELEQRVFKANAELFRLQDQRHACRGLHTTLVVLVAHLGQRQLVLGHCGDSRAYLLTPEQGCLYRSRDHSLFEMWRAQGMVTPPPDNGHVLFTALGEPSDSLTVTWHRWQWASHQHWQVLLCSDGLWGRLAESTLLATLQPAQQFTHQGVAGLCEQAVKAQASPSDNVTALAVAYSPAFEAWGITRFNDGL